MIKISAVIITLNEEKSIERTLRALDWCAEIVVVDSGSTDRTLEICGSYGCKTFYRQFDGYGTQKQFAVTQASYDWIFTLDADEVVTTELREEIQAVFSSDPTDTAAFYVPSTLIFLDRMMRFGGEYKVPRLLLFNRNYGTFNDNTVHEYVEIPGKIQSFSNHILHYSYDSLHEYFAKFNAYTTAGAKELLKKGKKRSVLQVWTRLPITFLKLYLLKGCVLDGYPGFVWSLFSAFSPVVKYAKLNELRKKASQIPNEQIVT